MPRILAINPKRKVAKKKAAKKKTAKKKRRKQGGKTITTTVKKKTTVKTNPAKGRAKNKKKGVAMAKKKKGKRKSPKPKTIVKYKYRNKPKKKRGTRNPANPESLLGSTVAGVNVRQAFKDGIPLFMGMMSGKFLAKKFAEGGGEMENWNWKNYLWCIGGGLGGGIVCRLVFGSKSRTAQMVFLGAVGLAAYKLFTNDIAPRNATLEAWFGQDDTGLPEGYVGGYGYAQDTGLPEGYYGYAEDDEAFWQGTGQDEYTEAYGTLMQDTDGEIYVMGADGEWTPINDSERQVGGLGTQELVQVGGYGDDPDVARFQKVFGRAVGF